MDESLRLLAEYGQASLPPDRLGELASNCRARMQALGKARYGLLAQMLDVMDTAWSQFGALSHERQMAVDDLLRTQLPLVLDEPDEQAATSLAASLFESVRLAISAV